MFPILGLSTPMIKSLSSAGTMSGSFRKCVKQAFLSSLGLVISGAYALTICSPKLLSVNVVRKNLSIIYYTRSILFSDFSCI